MRKEILFTGTRLECRNFVAVVEREDYRSVAVIPVHGDTWNVVGTLMDFPTPEEIAERAAEVRANRNNGMQGHKDKPAVNNLCATPVRKKPLRDLVRDRMAAHDNPFNKREVIQEEAPPSTGANGWRP